MFKVETFVVRYTATNCYLVYSSAPGEAVVIDPGDRSEQLLRRIEELGLQIKQIINTHGHIDHTGGNDWLREKTGAPVAIHELDRRCYQDPFFNLSVLSYPTVLKDADLTVKEGDEIAVGEGRLRVIHTPGHSPGSICLLGPGVLFCGDTVFAGSVGRTDFPGGSYQQMMSSIREKILVLPGDLKLYPGHGPASVLEVERKTNPFLSEL
ncbi:glyoxylase-like metal-dependent hydrolase (beta-lactamase superfamily II) [Desulfofundulus luciae]|uniref:Glyoxylase-like metal-dependent hydrolase (Beta-lactamase superfamily II) n=1 Tax=Desulfofundulus luciae TaxID=74702 RepID=A0ABU0B3K9_9FIRM|nr:MBL fold metallo-hydrolase [Desulfofundulus luciae]MDQ0287311.1 glyoxylase-like metal-dependent hydrolase (beta-lactamase superfamily II) [Desulfofundulus luciae]